MAKDRRSPIRLELELDPDQPELLAGLDIWLELGLMSHEQVLRLCRSQLVCRLPIASPSQQNPFASSLPTTDEESPPLAESIPAGANTQDFLPAPPAVTPAARPTRPERAIRRPGPLSGWLQQLRGELSVVWLLGLGVFLVVLSSAVLAATQWAQFNAIGQYLVLFAYTGVFWGVGQWSAANPRLQLTSKTLQIISLLLTPLNLWAIDGLGVGQTGGGWLVGAIAILLLTGAAWWVLQRWASPPERSLNFLGLTYLHLGWFLPWMPLAAAYSGAIGSAVATVYNQWQPDRESRLHRTSFLIVLFALGLLLLRVLTVLEGNQWGQLGLAFGLYGAPLVWLGQQAEFTRLVQTEATDPAATPAPPPPRRPLTQWTLWGGRALLWWGWLLAVSDWPAQALVISALGLGLRLWQLSKLGRRWDLAFALAIALQIPFLAWELVPKTLQAAVIRPLTEWTGTADNPDVLLGLTLLPYVVLLIAAADYFYQRSDRKLARFSEGLALGLSSLLTLISFASTPVLVINLIASTINAFIVTLRRQPLQPWRVYATHTLALVTVAVSVENAWPQFAATRWTMLVFGLMAGELLASRGRRSVWQESAWDLGRVLAGLAYLLLWERLLTANFQTGLSLLGLSIPLVLLIVRGYGESVLALGLTAPLTLGLPWTRLLGLGAATALAAVNSGFVGELSVATLTVGFGLGWGVSLLHDAVPGLLPDNTYWYLVGAIATLFLWSLWRGLPSLRVEDRFSRLKNLYGLACDRWGFILGGVILLGLTLNSGILYAGLRPPHGSYVAALGVLMGGIFLRFWQRPEPVAVYSLGWAVELLVVEGLRWQGGTVLNLATATLILGALTLGLAIALRSRLPELLTPLRHLALLYALLSIALRATDFTAWTGWLTLGAALITLEVGRQIRVAGLRWLALVGISLGWYELVLYQLSQASGGHPADGLIVLAGVALLIMVSYRLSANFLDRRLALPEIELLVAAHSHWFIGSLLILLSAGTALIGGGFGLPWLVVGMGLAFVAYALLQGRSRGTPGIQSLWIYLGLTELVGWVALLRLVLPSLKVIDSWWSAVACGLAVALYWLPWQEWGWPQQPWRKMAVIVPLSTLLLTGGMDHVPSLWITAGFYGWLAWSSRRVRLSYLSAGLGAWAIWMWLWERSISDNVALVAPVGLALIYVSQVDPTLKEPKNRELRHWLRVIGLGLILVVALASKRWTGLPVGAISLAAIALGLVLRTRAYLYIGTVIFGLNAINQLILLNADYPLIKWIIGILVGVSLIWIAADFERRREQWLSLTQGWLQELNHWS